MTEYKQDEATAAPRPCMRCGRPIEVSSRSAFRCLACAAEWRERMSGGGGCEMHYDPKEAEAKDEPRLCMRCGKPREATSRSAFRCLACAAEWRERMSGSFKRY